jgi:hypothetical protein
MSKMAKSDPDHVTFVDFDELVMAYLEGAVRRKTSPEQLPRLTLIQRVSFVVDHRRTIKSDDCDEFVVRKDIWNL